MITMTTMPHSNADTPNNVPSQMHAIVYETYGGPEVLHSTMVDIPKRKSDEILIRVAAASVNPIDYRLRSGEAKGIIPGGFPRVPGYDVAGVVIETDEQATIPIGSRVIAFLDHVRGGAYAEFAVCAATVCAVLPESLDLDVAAAIPLAGTTALQSLRDHGRLKKNERVLINGASGGVGMFAVQIAKTYGAHVTAVSGKSNRDFCMGLGADSFIDYEETKFTSQNEKWDLIFDAAGKASYLECRNVMDEGGRFVSTEPDIRGMLMTLFTWPFSKSGTIMLARPNGDDLRELLRLHEAGKLKINIDRKYPMRKAADAHAHIESGIDHGKIVLISEF